MATVKYSVLRKVHNKLLGQWFSNLSSAYHYRNDLTKAIPDIQSIYINRGNPRDIFETDPDLRKKDITTSAFVATTVPGSIKNHQFQVENF